jgi:3-oxoacyl-[acyl-carrier-protein] synthase III
VIAAVQSRVGLVSVGAAVPERVVTNDEIAQRVATSDEWIVTRTGIRERRVAAPDEYAHDLALRAAEDALDRSGLAPAQIDLVVCATTSPASFFPSTAVLVAEAVGAHGAGAYDLAAACTGFPYALSQAIGQIQAGLAEHALVIGADTLSKVLDWDDRATCILFGDGAGAVVLSADAADEHTLAIELGADGARAGDLYVHALDPSDRFLRMNGGEVYKFATRTMVDASTRLLERTGLQVGDVDWWIPHQANQRIIDHAVRRLEIDPARVLTNLDRFGNTSAGSIPICLEEAWRAGRIQAGDRLMMIGFGGGLAWGACLMEWAGQPQSERDERRDG